MMHEKIKRTAALALFIFIAALFAVGVYAIGEMTSSYGGNYGGSNGGRIGENNNSPSANGGGAANTDPVNGGLSDVISGGRENNPDDYAETEEGEVLGVFDRENSATVGIVIAILIAVAVIVLIVALLPRGTNGV